MSEASKVKVVGFLNQLGYFPMGVIAIVEMREQYYFKPPSSSELMTPINGAKNEEDLLRCPNFWKDTGDRYLDISRNEVAFAFSREYVFIGTLEEVFKEIQKQHTERVLPSNVLRGVDSLVEELKKEPASSCYFV